MVRLTSFSLNSLRDLVHQVKPAYDAISHGDINIVHSKVPVSAEAVTGLSVTNHGLAGVRKESPQFPEQENAEAWARSTDDPDQAKADVPGRQRWVSAALLARYDRQVLYDKIWNPRLSPRRRSS